MISPYQIFRPFLWVAAMAFFVGFAGFLLLGRDAFASDGPQFEAAPAAPASYEAPVAPNPMRAA